ncbi:F0F1 ATP synthase assembly protein I [Halomonas sp. ZH2S]|uniref:F0F1 ATP synthase assembly protein I n=1 Tax=Vreelandella zhuhanensis TaxID=2684210 RepID=A0A7X3KR62_9GAMM|nr:ATP synthase subunit I [Halomonas zhuhanensis]MWJ29220.1 F0F1 ATP synthase assembly protein I [Halomonas zhuhanensis]
MHKTNSVQRRRMDFRRLFLAQGLAILVTMGIAAWWDGLEGLVSALLGGLVGLLPSVYFVWRGSRQRGGKTPRAKALNFYQAAMGKFGLTVALFVVVFIAAPPSNPAFFFSAYVAVVLMHWLAPWLMPGNRPIDLR